MTGDLSTNEFAQFRVTRAEALGAPVPDGLAVLHEYGRLAILDGPAERAAAGALAAPSTDAELTETETLGAAALAERQSEGFHRAKRARPNEGLSWGVEGRRAGDGPTPIHSDAAPEAEQRGEPGTGGAEGAPMAGRMAGRIAVGLVIVEGSVPHLRFTENERTKVVAEVQNGLSWLAARSPARDVTFVHHIRVLTVDAAEATAGDAHEAFERPWRDAALRDLGLAEGPAGVRSYASQMRAALQTDWGYVAFFTKYRLFHFAYAVNAQAKLVMHYENDNWGPDDIDRVFAHETGHIFGAPDEYPRSGCSCGGAFGHFGRPNSNCESCAPGGGVQCIMRANTWEMCAETPYHLGYNGLPPLVGPVA